MLNTICPRSLDQFYIVNYYINWVTIWIGSRLLVHTVGQPAANLLGESNIILKYAFINMQGLLDHPLPIYTGILLSLNLGNFRCVTLCNRKRYIQFYIKNATNFQIFFTFYNVFDVKHFLSMMMVQIFFLEMQNKISVRMTIHGSYDVSLLQSDLKLQRERERKKERVCVWWVIDSNDVSLLQSDLTSSEKERERARVCVMREKESKHSLHDYYDS